eukprot:maker-scaffold_4-snap-gene-5.64-mRNA-1 protein AED:0.00 eAED:0.00 QI:98/1/1/1/1/1/2/171/450
MSGDSKDYIEYEIRTSLADSRIYNLAKFPVSASESNGTPVPDFGKTFVEPIYIQYEEIPDPMKKDGDQNNFTDTNSKQPDFLERHQDPKKWGRRRYRHKKQFHWKLTDKSQDLANAYFGLPQIKGDNKSRFAQKEKTPTYVVLVPPIDKTGNFRMMNLTEMYQFQKGDQFKPLSIDQVNEIMDKKVKVNGKLMTKVMKLQKAEFEKNKRKGKKTSNEYEAIEATGFSEEEDVAELAIDRMAEGGGEFADVDVDFSDDEVDKNEEVEEDEEIKEAEEFHKIEENENDEESGNELDGDLKAIDEGEMKLKEDSFLYAEKEDDNENEEEKMEKEEEKIDVQPSLEYLPEEEKQKVERQNFANSLLKRKQDEMKKEEQPEKKKVKQISFKEMTVEDRLVYLLKTNGRMKTKDLLKAYKEKGETIEDQKQFKAALGKVAVIMTDPVLGKVFSLRI